MPAPCGPLTIGVDNPGVIGSPWLDWSSYNMGHNGHEINLYGLIMGNIGVKRHGHPLQQLYLRCFDMFFTN